MVEETMEEIKEEELMPIPEETAEPLPTEAEETSAEHEAEAAQPPLCDEDYERIAREDLEALKAQFPALSGLPSLRALKNPVRYAELRELGLSPAEAYLATGGVPQKKSDNRAHLKSAVPRMGAIGATALTSEEMAEARRLFSDLSDAQIHRLYKKVTI
jgi:hypothetical protein